MISQLIKNKSSNSVFFGHPIFKTGYQYAEIIDLKCVDSLNFTLKCNNERKYFKLTLSTVQLVCKIYIGSA